ncbi:hypothetical protein Ocin01_17064 [Orchesella cincta]|uniref:Uncharacterized protein n=1 Tax=Orchesella cincta TaxID=48709 RepID=A0A1D2M9P5_ORCCI|nr:hypothetical protein Ocin01_17064 [Orchesella cincta]
MSCGRPSPCCPPSCCPPPCCPPACCPPIVIKTRNQQQQGQCCVFQLPPVNIVCEIPPPPKNKNPPKVCCIPLVMCEDDDGGNGGGGCCPKPQPCCPSPCGPPCCIPIDFGCPQRGGAGGCGQRNRREKRWPQCNFLKPCIDARIYRNGEHLCISYAGHIPGEQYIHGRNLPTTTTFAKRRLCQYTPYEFVDPDGCCSFCVFP